MKFNYINYKKITCILIGSIVIANCGGCSNINKQNSNNISIQTTTPNYTNKPVPTVTPIPSPTNTPVSTVTPNPTNISNQNIINLFKDIEKETEEIIENDKNSLEYAKALFVTLIDFIFFEKKFDNIKFDDLTEEEKRQILEITSSIDAKLEGKFPNYRENIIETGNDVYNKASEIIKNGSQNIKDFTKEKLGEDFYISLIEAKNDIKYFSIDAWGYIKNFSIDSYEKGKQYIKDWYNSIK